MSPALAAGLDVRAPKTSFESLDANSDGLLSRWEYLDAFSSAHLDHARDQVAEDFISADLTSDGSLDFVEYWLLLSRTPAWSSMIARRCQAVRHGFCDEIQGDFSKIHAALGLGVTLDELLDAFRESEFRPHFERLFHISDIVRDGKLEPGEFEFFQAVVTQTAVDVAIVDASERLIRMHDTDGDGKLDNEEVVRIALTWPTSEARREIMADMLKGAFPDLDADGDGSLDNIEVLALVELVNFGSLQD